MLGRSATLATCSAPFSSAIRRRASASTIAVKPPTRRPAPRSASSSVMPPPRSACTMRSTSSAGATRCSAVYADHDDRPGPRPGMAPNRPTISAASCWSRCSSPLSSASASCLAERRQRGGVVADAARRRRARRRPRPSDGDAAADEPREVQVEQRVEGGPLGLPLDQRGGVALPHRRAVGPVEGGERGDGVEVLGERDRQAGAPQRLEEGDVAVDQPAPACASPVAHRSSQLLDRAVVVGAVLEDDAEGVGDGLVVEVADLERDQGAGPVDGLGDRRRLLELELAQPADRRDQLARRPCRRGRAPASRRSRARARRRGSRGAGRGSGA